MFFNTGANLHFALLACSAVAENHVEHLVPKITCSCCAIERLTHSKRGTFITETLIIITHINRLNCPLALKGLTEVGHEGLFKI